MKFPREYIFVPDWRDNRRWFEERKAPAPAYLVLRDPTFEELGGLAQQQADLRSKILTGQIVTGSFPDVAKEFTRFLEDNVVSIHNLAWPLADGGERPIAAPADLLHTSSGFLGLVVSKIAFGQDMEDWEREKLLRQSSIIASSPEIASTAAETPAVPA